LAKEGIFMTTTTSQHCSWVVLNDTDKYITKAENDIEDDKRLLLAVADSMNNLCEKLSRLEYLLNRKSME
jgi:phage terminase large subunit-like protein